ncbi:MAG: glycyl-radical enzyme activating protein [Clostridia bacterium]|nr:glycyl-radical enzyme activating protein [Clostridia bacterium]
MGKIFDIQRFCVHDGPGIRTTVFMKGCPLKCKWCHNPESQTKNNVLAFYADKCVGCGACTEVCERHSIVADNNTENQSGFHHLIERESCVACGKCSEKCLHSALEIMGREASADEIMAEVMRDATFYKTSGGGLTVSGGEPLAQPEFLVELLTLAKQAGLHVCIETCGFAASKTIESIIPLTDLFLFDYKASGDDIHRELTGVPLTPIVNNLKSIDRMGGKTVLRCPLIPSVNLTDEHLYSIAELAAELDNLTEINVMAYHTLGNSKYAALHMHNPLPDLPPMSNEEKQECIRKITAHLEELTRGSGKQIKVL